MLISKMLILLLALFPVDNKWQRITTDQGISFLFPNHMQKLERLTDNIPSTIYQTKDLTCVFGIVCSDFSKKNIILNDENTAALYEQLKKGSISMESAILKSERTVPYDNMLIKEIEYSIIKDNYEMTYFKRFIFRGNMVYQVSIGGRTRHLAEIKNEREIFFGSISFTDLETNIPNT